MNNNLKKHLLELINKNEIEQVLAQLERYFKNNKTGNVRFEESYIQLSNEYLSLRNKWVTNELSDVAFEEKTTALRHELAVLIHKLANEALKPEAAQAEKSKSSSVFDKIAEAVKNIPGNFFPSGKKSQASGRKKGNQPASPAFEEKADEAVFERMNEPELPNSSAGPALEEMVQPSPVVPPPAPPAKPSPTQTGGMQSPFQQGKILYAIPNKMCIGQSIRCKIRIANEQFSMSEMEKGLDEKEKAAATNEAIKITPIMKVELEENGDADNFDIHNRNTIEQPILPFGFTEWAFDVTAKRPGHYALLLRVSAKINMPVFGERAFDVAVLDRAILVNIGEEADTEIEFAEQPIPDPDWDTDDEQAVLAALENGRVDMAIERIANFVQDKDQDFHKEIILLHARWNDNTNQLSQQLISPADWDIVNNKVRFAITQLLDQLKESFSIGANAKSINWIEEKAKLR